MSNAQVIHTLRGELEALKQELAVNPTYVKICKIQELLRVYEDGARASSGAPAAPSAPTVSPIVLLRHMTRTARAKRIIADCIREGGGVAMRRDILDRLTTQGILQGKKPMKSLVRILADAKEFESDGRGAWRIAAQPTRENGGAV